jgi:chromosomal replication initiation ATPase DnaA
MNLWDEILTRIETKVNRHSFYTWFKPTAFVSEDLGALTVRVPNPLFKDWLTKHYAGVISEAMAEMKKAGLPVKQRHRRLLRDCPDSILATPSTRSSSDLRINSPTLHVEPLLKRLHGRTTRCLSTVGWGLEKRT